MIILFYTIPILKAVHLKWSCCISEYAWQEKTSLLTSGFSENRLPISNLFFFHSLYPFTARCIGHAHLISWPAFGVNQLNGPCGDIPGSHCNTRAASSNHTFTHCGPHGDVPPNPIPCTPNSAFPYLKSKMPQPFRWYLCQGEYNGETIQGASGSALNRV